jgi:hypothetical protein
MYGPMAALFVEMFGTRTRYTGASLGYQLAAVLGAGFAPLVAGSLLARAGGGTHSELVALFLVASCVITAVAVWLVRETRGQDLAPAEEATPVPAAELASA